MYISVDRFWCWFGTNTKTEGVSQGGPVVKTLPALQETIGLIPELGRTNGGGNNIHSSILALHVNMPYSKKVTI